MKHVGERGRCLLTDSKTRKASGDLERIRRTTIREMIRVAEGYFSAEELMHLSGGMEEAANRKRREERGS